MRSILLAAIMIVLCTTVASAQADSIEESETDSIPDTVRTFVLDTLVASVDLHLAVSHDFGIRSLFSEQHRHIHSPIAPAFNLAALRLTSDDRASLFQGQFALLMQDYWLHACEQVVLYPDSRDIRNQFKWYSPVNDHRSVYLDGLR